MKNYFLILGLLFGTVLSAQNGSIDFDNYQALKCAGTIPKDFRTLSQDKFRNDVKQETKTSKNHNVSSSKQEFLLTTNYVVDQLLLSGKVLFGDTVTNYVNQVADRVLADEPELRAKLRFYCLRSAEPNAFSTNQGIIFVTLGLIAQLENEAQLAFIISHEVAHYEKRHTINEYLHNETVFSDRDRYKYDSYDDQIRSASSFSKELELEADSLGLARLARTGYSCDEAIGSLFVLQFSELPFEDFEFSANFLETPIMQLPLDLFLDSVRPIDLDNDNEDDSYSSHPNIATRRTRLEYILERLDNCGNQKFAASNEAFFTVRKICRFETVRIQLNRKEYCASLYNAFVLQREDSASSYLRLCIGKALYGMAKFKNHSQFSSVTEYYGKKEGNQQQCYYLFQSLEAEQLNMVALRYLYDLSVSDSSYLVTSMRDDLAEEAVRVHNVHYEDLEKALALYLEVKNAPADTAKKEEVVKEETAAEPGNNKAFVSKYDKLRQEKKKLEQKKVVETKKSEASKFHLLVFADMPGNSSVKAMFAKAETAAAEQLAVEKAEQERIDKMSSYEYRKMKQQGDTEMRKKGISLGIDTVVFIDPFYFIADDRKGLNLIKSESEKLEFCNQIRENAGYSGLSIDLLNPKAYGPDDVEKYNDLAVVNDWMGERLEFEEDFDMIPLETDRMMPLVKKYNTSHFCYTGIYNYKQRRENRGFIIFLSVICYPLLPVGLTYALTPEHHTYYYTFMYDVTTGREDVTRTVHLKSKSKKGFVNSIMYDMMVQIKREPKQKTSK